MKGMVCHFVIYFSFGNSLMDIAVKNNFTNVKGQFPANSPMLFWEHLEAQTFLPFVFSNLHHLVKFSSSLGTCFILQKGCNKDSEAVKFMVKQPQANMHSVTYLDQPPSFCQGSAQDVAAHKVENNF